MRRETKLPGEHVMPKNQDYTTAGDETYDGGDTTSAGAALRDNAGWVAFAILGFLFLVGIAIGASFFR